MCVDQDECQIFGICDQKCTNLEEPQTYFCDCERDGYEVFDGRHCRAVNVPRSEPASLLFANSVDIKHVFLDGSPVSPGNVSAIVRTNETLALDFDHRKRRFCWIEHNRQGDDSRYLLIRVVFIVYTHYSLYGTPQNVPHKPY